MCGVERFGGCKAGRIIGEYGGAEEEEGVGVGHCDGMY